MILFTKLLLAHLLGDFLLQPVKWVVHKEANKIASKYLYFHILIHFGLIMLFLWDMELWWWAIIIALSHYVIDLSKIYTNPYFKNKAIPFFVDQVLHLVVLYCCAFNSDLIGHTVGLIQGMNWPLVTAVVFVSYPSSIIMAKLLEGMSHRIELDHKSLPNAGKYIGIIERLFVLIFIILGRWEAIGLLITAKSVFRFNDLKESNSRKLTEYILIGTLLSFGLAILTGLFYLGVR
ncbi:MULTISPECIES: DUF3307 domain-containing protein [unclassified Arenibacter]|uniref:DUF3307 domain-containing protein n=1 Tax=unclassified Arenibacter TaxID=2615047 RepID=UPI000E344E93|nr:MULTISPECIES: DUF3307 domain-containing protein [unclassified Arenibacter]MCM4165689.1 DUF3307 domain-containing protein [Arenibacter sp. A80]RFT54542.1 DUF3307 domain-containing protein [Arenibacter sp. P308M17]